MTHPAPAAPQPRHPDSPAPAARTDKPPVTRPEHHPAPARRATRTRDPHAPAQLRIHLDRQRARPYHDHRRSPPQIPPRARQPNQARGDLSLTTGNSKILPRDRRHRQRHRQRARPDTTPRSSSNQAVNTSPPPATDRRAATPRDRHRLLRRRRVRLPAARHPLPRRAHRAEGRSPPVCRADPSRLRREDHRRSPRLHDELTGVLASSLAKRAPGYTSLGFPDPRKLSCTPSAAGTS